MRKLFYLSEIEHRTLKSQESCALQYILLHLLGYKLSMDDLKAFRQVDSLTPGHPEAGHTDGEYINDYCRRWY